MRTIVNISLPKEMADQIKREVKREGYASTSEFIRTLMRAYNRTKLAEELNSQIEDFKKNKKGWKELKSLKDLDT